MIIDIAEKKFLQAFENIEYGSIVVTMPNGKAYGYQGKQAGPKGEMIIHDTSMIINLYVRGDIGFADDYRRGKWDSPDLVTLIQACLINEEALDKCIFGSSFFRAAIRFSYIFKRNTITGSRNNIHAHYDIGNEFYKLWLDETMSYSAAIFNDNNQALADAQNNKYGRILQRLGGNPSKILEVGCGWGGFAEQAIATAGHKVKGLTISTEQHGYALERVGKLGCKDSVIALEDYRLQTQKFDNIVSIEMFEAVGEKYWKTYFDKLASVMNAKGKAVIQTITIDDKYFERYKKGGDFIRSFIFPGGMLPGKKVFKQSALNSGLKTTDLYEFGHDYATTLK
ncbi:MAG: cyclopropane-fatty-acyl-phospholipid synthase family protein, partial [Rickettsiales bacterium]